MQAKKILLVDDSDVVLEASRVALEKGGFSVITLDNPFAVPYVVRKEHPDLVMIDVNMPTMSGDLVAKIVASYGIQKKAPILLYSDLPEFELAQRVQSSGASGFIRKSVTSTRLVERVRSWLQG